MKKTHTIQSILLGAALLTIPVSGYSSVLTSFETSEGFTANSRTNTAGWTFSNNTRIRVSDGTTEPVLDGSLSLYTQGGSAVVTATNTENWADKEDKLNIYSFSFITTEDSTWRNQGNAAWIYIFLWDDTTQSRRAFQITAKYGDTTEADHRVTYNLDDGSGGSTTTTRFLSQSTLNFKQWNTISADFDFTAGTYDLRLNDAIIANNVLLPTDWDVSAIVGTWLVSPGDGTTTYYDMVTAIPEPSILGLFGVSLLALQVRRKRV